MKRIAVIAIAVLAGCAGNPPPPPPQRAVTIEPNVVAYQPGNGVVQRVMPTPGQPMQRLEIRMDNGVVQYVDTDSKDFARGMRVSLTEGREIRKL